MADGVPIITYKKSLMTVWFWVCIKLVANCLASRGLPRLGQLAVDIIKRKRKGCFSVGNFLTLEKLLTIVG